MHDPGSYPVPLFPEPPRSIDQQAQGVSDHVVGPHDNADEAHDWEEGEGAQEVAHAVHNFHVQNEGISQFFSFSFLHA